ncbi:MAG: SRPBCC domain-containing protein [Alphaproteobacteria bacterium]|nr:SRPBCC domain-containing protein [Alphaproteobacteria bacterium]
MSRILGRLCHGRRQSRGSPEPERLVVGRASVISAATVAGPEMQDSTESIVVTNTFPEPVALVWKALTDAPSMRQWFFEPITAFEPVIGHVTEFVVAVDGIDYPHLWNVLEVEPGRRLAYRWRYPGFAGDSTVTWELAESPGGTRVTLTHVRHEPFPEDNPIFSRDAARGAWEYYLHKGLPAFLSQLG